MKIDVSKYADVGKSAVIEINGMTDAQLINILYKAWIIIGEIDVKPLDGAYADEVADPVQEMSKEDVILSCKIADIQLCQYHVEACRYYLEIEACR